ncbi:MAG: tRNA (guanosine(37)-N1)-methyltransferase TrmD [Planctomycetes bacterium]|nr:tRNA (guanosine(37)-N1)-methyltransferase TrmD [Planctomycetota bacterium]
MLVYILTLFPDAIEPYISKGVLRVARDQGKIDVRLLNFRDFAKGKHRNVDDRPFGGGPGMLLCPEPIFEAIEWIESREGIFHKVLLTPDGHTFRQSHAESLTKHDRLLFLCGRYEGFDQRILDGFAWERLSIGDYVLSGGELPALVILEATVRLIPGVLGDEESPISESFTSELLDYPQYTRPREFRGSSVPDVLMSGDHEAIRRWREDQARHKTKKWRPDIALRGDTNKCDTNKSGIKKRDPDL